VPGAVGTSRPHNVIAGRYSNAMPEDGNPPAQKRQDEVKVSNDRPVSAVLASELE
jgi:hypothetical protein